MEELYAAGKLKPPTESNIHPEHAADSSDLAVKGTPRGKIVVTLS
jgi:hypothetical protein